jgi:flavin-binding protein dodecin
MSRSVLDAPFTNWNLQAPNPLGRGVAAKSQQEFGMSVAKVIEITSLSKKSFEDAITEGIKRAGKTVSNIEGAWIKEQKVQVKDGKIIGFRVNMNLTFVLDD